MSLDDLRDRFLVGVNRLFSRKMLGSVLFGTATSYVLDYAIAVQFSNPESKFFIWSGLWVTFLFTFVFWERLETISDSVDPIGE